MVDLRLFKGKVFSTAAVTQFLSNGVQFVGQMLIPAFLIQACGRTPGEMGWMLAPLGFGMMVTYPLMGMLTDRFGIRCVSASGALLALVGTVPFLYLATHRLALFVLIPALFFRGMGMSGVGLPSMTAAYVSVSREKLPMATTSLNNVQRLGGPTMTTICASFLTWKLGLHLTDQAVSSAFFWAFLLLCGLHALTFASAARLPLYANGSDDKPLFRRLLAGEWIGQHQNILICGPTGMGKTYLACALANTACRQGKTASYQRLPRLFEALAVARGDGQYPKWMTSFSLFPILVTVLGWVR